MVYRGKLSKACLPCRKRKLLCDLNRNGCSQCRRAQLVCSGYRDTQALRISDETIAVHAKMLSKIPKDIQVSMAHQAKDLFFYNNVAGTAQPLDFLKSYYVMTPGTDEHLAESIDAVSLAYLNFQKRTATAQSKARQHYVTALKLTNSVLQDPKTSKRDSTLLSVLLLDMYEKITNREPDSKGAWAAHINGALALVKLRGEQQYRDPLALRMLIRLSTNMLISCIVGGQPAPPELVSLRDAIFSSFAGCNDPKWRESNIMLDVVELRYRLKCGTLSSSQIVSTAKIIDSKFEELAKDIDQQWQYEVVYVGQKSRHHFEPFHHLYEQEEFARMWNVLRHTRLILHELIWLYSPAKDTITRDMANQTINQMAREICATVPQFINEVINIPHSAIEDPGLLHLKPDLDGRKYVSSAAQATYHLPCYRLIYPLYMVAQSPCTSTEMQAWAIGQLEYMAEFHAIENASRVAEIIKSKVTTDPWDVYALLGSYAFVC